MTHRIAFCPQLPNRGGKRTHQVTLSRAQIFVAAGGPWEPQLLYYAVKLGNKIVNIMIDSGASVNCMDERLLNAIGGVLKRHAPGTLLYPDRRPAKVKGTAEVVLRGQRVPRQSSVSRIVEGLGVEALAGRSLAAAMEPEHRLEDERDALQ